MPLPLHVVLLLGLGSRPWWPGRLEQRQIHFSPYSHRSNFEPCRLRTIGVINCKLRLSRNRSNRLQKPKTRRRRLGWGTRVESHHPRFQQWSTCRQQNKAALIWRRTMAWKYVVTAINANFPVTTEKYCPNWTRLLQRAFKHTRVETPALKTTKNQSSHITPSLAIQLPQTIIRTTTTWQRKFVKPLKNISHSYSHRRLNLIVTFRLWSHLFASSSNDAKDATILIRRLCTVAQPSTLNFKTWRTQLRNICQTVRFSYCCTLGHEDPNDIFHQTP